MRVAGAVAAVFLLLSACGQERESSVVEGEMGDLIAHARASGLDEGSQQFRSLEDGVVTYDEYRQGFADSVACVEDHGIVVERQYTNKYDSWRLAWLPDVERSVPEGGDEDWSAICGVEHVMYLEIGYGLTAPDRVDAQVLAHASACLAAISGPIDPGVQSIAAIVDSVGDRDAALECLDASMRTLFPEESAGYVE